MQLNRGGIKMIPHNQLIKLYSATFPEKLYPSDDQMIIELAECNLITKAFTEEGHTFIFTQIGLDVYRSR
jgi:hypothetical protein